MPERVERTSRTLSWHLRAYLNRPVSLRRTLIGQRIAGQRILITGASSGIGRATALHLAGRGACVILVARRADELSLLNDEISAAGGDAEFHGCDLTNRGEVDALVKWVLDKFGGVDILVNNAGRSMRRPIDRSFERLDDFDRTMAVNYFGPVHLTMGLLPSMLEQRSGHIVNIGTWTVPVAVSPRFAAYHASKAALAAFGRCVDAELVGRHVRVTAVHFPLVHTEMSAPTAMYSQLPGLTPNEAARWIERAIEHRPLQITPRYALALRTLGAFAPRTAARILLHWG